MGFAKRHAEELESRGFDEIEGDVCPECVEDEYLKDLIRHAADEGVCAFCEQRGSVTAADAVAGEILSALYSEYCDPVHEMPVDGGEYVELSPFRWTEDVFDEVCSSAFSPSGDAFYQAVLDSLPS